MPFFAFAPGIRKMIYTTNCVEALNRSLRKIIKTRGSFPNDEAALKLVYLYCSVSGASTPRRLAASIAASTSGSSPSSISVCIYCNAVLMAIWLIDPPLGERGDIKAPGGQDARTHSALL